MVSRGVIRKSATIGGAAKAVASSLSPEPQTMVDFQQRFYRVTVIYILHVNWEDALFRPLAAICLCGMSERSLF